MMCPAFSARISPLLANCGHSNQEAPQAPVHLIRDPLRDIARCFLGCRRPDHSVQVQASYLQPVQLPLKRQFWGVANEVWFHRRGSKEVTK